jgi:diaminopimelate epimerase
MTMKFTKMHGLGNDYLFVDCFTESVTSPAELARRVSDRHFGVGGDGLVLIMPSQSADAMMRIFNADGSEAEMCGNALRCVAKYLYEHRGVRQKVLTVETRAGIKTLTIILENSQVNSVRADLGPPSFTDNRLFAVDCDVTRSHPMQVNNHGYQFTAVSMGNPHCVIFVPQISEEMLKEDGPALEISPLFPQKTNVEFVQIESENSLRMRVWERGSGETMACGTGACAAVAAACHNGLTTRQVMVHLLGGDLLIEWDQNTNHLLMTGPAVEVFHGEWPVATS